MTKWKRGKVNLVNHVCRQEGLKQEVASKVANSQSNISHWLLVALLKYGMIELQMMKNPKKWKHVKTVTRVPLKLLGDAKLVPASLPMFMMLNWPCAERYGPASLPRFVMLNWSCAERYGPASFPRFRKLTWLCAEQLTLICFQIYGRPNCESAEKTDPKYRWGWNALI